jgi:hypothetical protein
MQSAGFTDTSHAAGAEGFSSPYGAQQFSGQRYGGDQLSPIEAATDFFRDYARERPEVVAMWAFGLVFVLGWKLKPW